MKQCNEYSNEFYANFYLFNSNIERRIDSTTTFFNINKLFFEKKEIKMIFVMMLSTMTMKYIKNIMNTS